MSKLVLDYNFSLSHILNRTGMDLFDSNRFPNRKHKGTERFLGVSSHTPTFVENTTADELHEDDVVFSRVDCYAEHNRHNSSSTPSPSFSAAPLIHHNSFGILAALPENKTSCNLQSFSKFFNGTSVPPTSRLISAIPRPSPHYEITALSSSSSVKYYHQSAPVDIPILSEAMKAQRRRYEKEDEVEEEEEEEMLPPHEIVARKNSVQAPLVACSVIEGVGRSLKGRDKGQVRNAVWPQTSFPS